MSGHRIKYIIKYKNGKKVSHHRVAPLQATISFYLPAILFPHVPMTSPLFLPLPEPVPTTFPRNLQPVSFLFPNLSRTSEEQAWRLDCVSH